MIDQYIPWIVCLILGAFVASAAFVGRMVYVEGRRRWRKAAEPPQVPVKFRQQTVSIRQRSTTDEPLPPRRPRGTAHVRPIRRSK